MSVAPINSAAPLPPNAPLWRYMKFSTCMLLLQGTAFFPSVATLRAGDPLEGDLVPEPEWLMTKLHELCALNTNLLEAWLEAKADDVESIFLKHNRDDPALRTKYLSEIYVRELAKRRAVWCWFQSLHESAAMWSLYANAGIAIRTSVGDLMDALPPSIDFQIAPIAYVNRSASSSLRYFNPEADTNQELIARPHLIKGIEYEHEHEVRITTTCAPDEKGHLVKGIAVANLVKEVVISPLLPFDEAKAVELVIRNHPWEKAAPSIRRSSILGGIAEREESIARVADRLHTFQWTEKDLPFPLTEL